MTDRRELERTYRELFEGVSDGLVLHDPETGEIRDVNERFCEMNGYGREELVGERVDTVTAPREAYSFERAREMIGRAEAGPQLFEWRNQHADGHSFPVEVHLSLVTVRGRQRVLASVRDISERRRRRRQLEAIFGRIDEAVALSSEPTTVGRPEYLSPAIETLPASPTRNCPRTCRGSGRTSTRRTGQSTSRSSRGARANYRQRPGNRGDHRL